MKAVQTDKYSSPPDLTVREINTPVLNPEQLLVLVRSVSLNPFDAKLLSGVYRENIPVSFPIIPASDFAGIIEEADEKSGFTKGDKVFGSAGVLAGGTGALAEIAAVNVKKIAKLPELVSFDNAAASVLVGVSAYQALLEHIALKAGQTILIHGGAGGIGHFAIQLAVSMGAKVITTVSAEDTEFVKGLGAEVVIDYKNTKFEETVKDCDAVFDTVGGDIANRSANVIRRGGVLVTMAAEPDKDLFAGKGVNAVKQNTQVIGERLEKVAGLLETGAVKVYIDKIFTLDRTVEAFEYMNKSQRGKIVISVEE